MTNTPVDTPSPAILIDTDGDEKPEEIKDFSLFLLSSSTRATDHVFLFKSLRITDKASLSPSLSPAMSKVGGGTGTNAHDGRMLVIESRYHASKTFRSLVLDHRDDCISMFRDVLFFLETINHIYDHHIKIEEVRTSASSLQLKPNNNHEEDKHNFDDSQHGFIL